MLSNKIKPLDKLKQQTKFSQLKEKKTINSNLIKKPVVKGR